MTKKPITAAALLFSAALLAPTAAHALCVKVPEANLRQGPGTQYEKSWEVFAYMPFEKIDSQGNWYRVSDVDGDVHWIYNRLVTDDMRCAVISKEKVNVRTGPGTNYPLADVGTVEKYYSFKVLDEQGQWVKVEDDISNSGWIYRPLLWLQ